MDVESSAKAAGPFRAPTRGVLVLSAGMESAGSGWLFNMTNELLQAAGHRDVRDLRDEFGLIDVLHHDNCNVRDLTQEVWDRIEPALAAGHSFVVKSHKRPSELVRRLSAEGKVISTYIHRDPRDVVVSAFQRGERRRARGRTDSFGRIRSIYLGLMWMRARQLPVYEAWRAEPKAMLVRYEDLRNDATATLRALCEHLGLALADERIADVATDYEGENAHGKAGSHYRGGASRQDQLTATQLRLANLLFRRSLVSMGYELA